jgi:hypothetical protein
VNNVFIRLQLTELRIQLQKHILCGLFRKEAIAQYAQGNAENHRLVFQHQRTEGILASYQVYILPSIVYTPASAQQDAEFCLWIRWGTRRPGTKEYCRWPSSDHDAIAPAWRL